MFQYNWLAAYQEAGIANVRQFYLRWQLADYSFQ